MTDIDKLASEGGRPAIIAFLKTADVAELTDFVMAVREPSVTGEGREPGGRKTERDKLYTHLRDRTDRMCGVAKDGTVQPVSERVLERLDQLPEAVTDNPALVTAIQELALVAAGSLLFSTKTKPDRIESKAIKLVDLLHDGDIIDQLNMQLSPPKAGRTLKAIESALGYWRAPCQDSSVAAEVGVNYKPVVLDADQLAVSVRDALRARGITANTSKTGALVQTLEAIRNATGFKTSSEKAAGKACKDVN